MLEVIAANNKVSKKSWQFERLGSFGNSKAVIRFTAPAEVKGVALLVVNHPDRSVGPMDVDAGHRAGPAHRTAGPIHAILRHGLQLRRSGRARREPVRFPLVGDEAIDGAACWRIESTPRESKASQYTRSFIWIRKDNYVPAD